MMGLKWGLREFPLIESRGNSELPYTRKIVSEIRNIPIFLKASQVRKVKGQKENAFLLHLPEYPNTGVPVHPVPREILFI